MSDLTSSLLSSCPHGNAVRFADDRGGRWTGVEWCPQCGALNAARSGEPAQWRLPTKTHGVERIAQQASFGAGVGAFLGELLRPVLTKHDTTPWLHLVPDPTDLGVNVKDHCTFGGDELRCLHCGTAQKLHMPISIGVITGAMKGFSEEHRNCKPSERGRERMNPEADPYEWRNSWDTGQSSLTIWHVMMVDGHGPGKVPQDPQDFGRCYRLLKLFPNWRADIAAMNRVPAWAPFVDRWDEMERLYEEELPSGRAPKLYQLMTEILGRGREAHAR